MFVNGRAMQFYIAHVPQHTFECKILLYHIDIHKSFKYSRCEEFDRHCTLFSLKVCMWKLMLWSGQYFYFFEIIDLWIKDKFKVKNFGGKHFFLSFLSFLSQMHIIICKQPLAPHQLAELQLSGKKNSSTAWQPELFICSLRLSPLVIGYLISRFL